MDKMNKLEEIKQVSFKLTSKIINLYKKVQTWANQTLIRIEKKEKMSENKDILNSASIEKNTEEELEKQSENNQQSDVDEENDENVKIIEIKKSSNELLSKVEETWKKIPGWIKKTTALVLAVMSIAGTYNQMEKGKSLQQYELFSKTLKAEAIKDEKEIHIEKEQKKSYEEMLVGIEEKMDLIKEENRKLTTWEPITWEQISKIRENNIDNPNYPHVFWMNVDDNILYVKVGDYENKAISPKEAIELFGTNELFVAEYNFLMRPTSGILVKSKHIYEDGTEKVIITEANIEIPEDYLNNIEEKSGEEELSTPTEDISFIKETDDDNEFPNIFLSEYEENLSSGRSL